MMLQVSVKPDALAMARLSALLDRVAKESPRRLATETRRAALYICQSLRKRTKTAPKKIRRSEYSAKPSPVPPRYIHSNSAGKPLLRRWQLTRKIGTPDENTHQYYVYTKARRGKGGKMVGKRQAEERRELLRFHGKIARYGLAKKSWGWVAKKIYAATGDGDLSWRRTKGERRDPRRYVDGTFGASSAGAYARIRNHLDYICDALQPNALNESINAAAMRLEHNIAKQIERLAR